MLRDSRESRELADNQRSNYSASGEARKTIAFVAPGFAKNRVGVYPVGMAVVEVKLKCEVGDGSCSGDGGQDGQI